MGKRRVPGIVIFLIVIGVIVGIPAAGYYGFIHDVSHKKIDYDPNFKTDKLLPNALNRAFDDVKTTKKLNLALSEQELNNAIYNGAKDLYSTGFVRGLYLEIKENKVDFVIEVDGVKNFFGTKIVMSTELKEEMVDGESAIIFAIKNIKLGRISGIDSFAISILKNFISENDINQKLSEVISAKVDLSKKQIVYKKKNLINDLDKVIPSEGGNLSFNSLIKLLIDNNLVSLNANGEVGFAIDLEPLTTSEEQVDGYDIQLNNPEKHNGVSLEGINTNLGKILTNNKDKISYKDSIYRFLFNGYNKLSDQDKGVIDSLNLDCMGASFIKETYKGFDLGGGTYDAFAGVSVSSVSEMGLTTLMSPEGFSLVEFNEATLNAYFQNLDIFGYGFVFESETNDVYNTKYVTVDNLYCNIYENKTSFVVGLNINGLETYLTINSEFNTTESKADFLGKQFKLVFDLKDIKFGTLSAGEEITSGLYKLLADSFTGPAKLQNKKLTLDFSDAVDSSTSDTARPIFEKTIFTYSCSGTTKEDVGAIKLSGKYNA